ALGPPRRRPKPRQRGWLRPKRPSKREFSCSSYPQLPRFLCPRGGLMRTSTISTDIVDVPVNHSPGSKAGHGPIAEAYCLLDVRAEHFIPRSRFAHADLVAAFLDQTPNAVDGVAQLRTGLAALVHQVRTGGAAHDEEVLLGHLAHDRVGIEEF